MSLPNFFLADLPPEAELTPGMIREACQALKRNRAQYLERRSSAQMLHVLSEVAQAWLDPEFALRRLALEQSRAATGFGPVTLARGLDQFFGQLTAENLHALLVQELGHAHRLDGWAASASESRHAVSAMARGPELLAHITAGNLPTPALLSIVLGLLTRSAQFVKCASGASFMPRLFAHSIHQFEPKLASCLEIAEWPGGTAALEEPLFEEAECVTATGSDEMLADLRRRLPARTRLVGYGRRVSFGYIAQEKLSRGNATKLVAQAAEDLVAWNQLGCLSPHLLYVQTGGALTPETFADCLASELARREEAEPRGELAVEEAALIASRRDVYRLRSAVSLATRLWCSEGSTAWTVVFEEDARFQVSCLNRFVYVKAVADLTQVLHEAEEVRGQVSTVGLAAGVEAIEQLAAQLAAWGVTRVCPIGRMQAPPLLWRHDGRPVLGDLVVWTDWEL
jgi:hypothetical protein